MKFLRRTSSRYSRLGKKRKKKQIWRTPTGRHNKMREKRKGYPIIVSIGYRTDKSLRGKIKDKKPVKVMNIKDLNKIGKENIAIIGKVGNKKKIEIIKAAREKNIEIANLNIDKIIKKNEVKKENRITSEEAKKIIESNKKIGEKQK